MSVFDGDTLFGGRCPRSSSTKTYLFTFLILQLLPILILFCGPFGPAFRGFLNLLIEIANVILCQNLLGKTLVGISWRFDFSNGVRFIESSEPEPFLPTKLNSNCFWMGIVTSAVIWTLVDLYYILTIRVNGLLPALLYLVLATLADLNCVMFLNIQRRDYRKYNEATRTFLLTGGGFFPQVGAVEEGQGKESDNGLDEDDIV
jgi:hypothetical protein